MRKSRKASSETSSSSGQKRKKKSVSPAFSQKGDVELASQDQVAGNKSKEESGNEVAGPDQERDTKSETSSETLKSTDQDKSSSTTSL